MSSITEYLESKNIKYSIQGNEVIITCPGCGKEKLYINQNSLVYHCFVCEAENPASEYARGHFSKLKELWGDIVDITPTPYLNNLIEDKPEADYSILVNKYHYNLLNNVKGKKYVFKRGFDESVIKKYKLGIVEMKGDLWLSIPSFEDGIPRLLKYRKITDNNPKTKKYEREFGSKSILFNGDALNEFNEIIVTEGECFTGDTEILTDEGWIRLDLYTGQKVLQINKDKSGNFVKPIAYIKKWHKGNLIDTGIISTPKHQLVYTSSNGELKKCKAIDAKIGYKIPIITYGNGINDSISITKKTFIKYEGYVYCVQVPSGMILIKQNNKITVTGNCDAIMLMEQGYDNVVGVTGGAGTLLPEWYDKLKLMSKITFIFDPDRAGQNAVTNTWIERLGINKCWNILLPKGYDVNSYFLNYTLEDFKKLEPYQVKLKGIVSLNDALVDMYSLSKSKDQILYQLPWPEINELIGGGLELQQLLVIGAQSSMGKTTMAMQIAHHFTKAYNMPCLIFCLEMTAVKLAIKYLQLEYDLTYNEVKYSDALIYSNDLNDTPIYFGYTPDITMEKLYNTIEEARNRYGVKFVVFDNLQLLVTSDKESMYAAAMKMFKKIPMSLNLIMCLISQPRKLNSEEGLNFDALKGSAAIAQASDHTLLIHRKRLKGVKTGSSFSEICQIINDKARFSAGGIRQLKINGAKSRFESMEG